MAISLGTWHLFAKSAATAATIIKNYIICQIFSSKCKLNNFTPICRPCAVQIFMGGFCVHEYVYIVYTFWPPFAEWRGQRIKHTHIRSHIHTLIACLNTNTTPTVFQKKVTFYFIGISYSRSRSAWTMTIWRVWFWDASNCASCVNKLNHFEYTYTFLFEVKILNEFCW